VRFFSSFRWKLLFARIDDDDDDDADDILDVLVRDGS